MPKLVTHQKQVAALSRNSEIRIRYVDPEYFGKLKEVAAMLKTKTVPDTVLKLIARYKGDQEHIRQLQARNSSLHASLAKYISREADQIDVIKDFIVRVKGASKEAILLSEVALKRFKGGAKKKPGKIPGAGSRSKNAPHKKQGRLL